MPTSAFGAKHPDEEDYFGADFAGRLNAGELITAGSCTVFLESDTTKTDISAMKSGSPLIVDSVVEQKIIGGEEGKTYILRFTAVTNMPRKLPHEIRLVVTVDE